MNDYKQMNASLGKLYLSNDPTKRYGYTGRKFQSFITKDNNYIIVLHNISGYNVYDMINDKWLLEKDAFKNSITFNTYDDSVKSLFINDDMIIISDGKYLRFCYIATQDLKYPIAIKDYLLQTKKLDYQYHGMSCIYLKCEKDKNKKMNHFSMKILLIGGWKNSHFFDSFLIVDLTISLPFTNTKPKNDSKNNFDFGKININVTKETKMDSSKLMNSISNNKIENRGWEYFSCICLNASRNSSQPIVLIVGGRGTIGWTNTNTIEDEDEDEDEEVGSDSSIFLLNTSKCHLKIIDNVCTIYI